MEKLQEFALAIVRSFLQWRESNPKLSLFAIIIACWLLFKKLRSLMRRPKSMQNKVVLVTGGASGIGRLTAISLKKKGATVIIWDINEAGLREMASHTDMCLKCDITSREQVMQCAATVLQQYPAVDILINNAGIVIGKPLLELEERHIRKTFEVNVISHFFTIQAFLPAMIAQRGGHIVTISSTAGYVGCAYLTDYCASKFACRGLHDSVMHELQELRQADGIHVTGIYPYMVSTGMFDGAIDSRSAIIRKLFGLEMLSPEFVASEIVRAIEYNIRDLVIPPKLKMMVFFEHILSDGFKDWLLSKGPSFQHLTGRRTAAVSQASK